MKNLTILFICFSVLCNAGDIKNDCETFLREVFLEDGMWNTDQSRPPNRLIFQKIRETLEQTYVKSSELLDSPEYFEQDVKIEVQSTKPSETELSLARTQLAEHLQQAFDKIRESPYKPSFNRFIGRKDCGEGDSHQYCIGKYCLGNTFLTKLSLQSSPLAPSYHCTILTQENYCEGFKNERKSLEKIDDFMDFLENQSGCGVTPTTRNFYTQKKLEVVSPQMSILEIDDFLLAIQTGLNWKKHEDMDIFIAALGKILWYFSHSPINKKCQPAISLWLLKAIASTKGYNLDFLDDWKGDVNHHQWALVYLIFDNFLPAFKANLILKPIN